MSTHGALLKDETMKAAQTLAGGEQVTFNYTEPFADFNPAKYDIDDNNNKQHDPISFEESWATK
eukprot:10439946-Ditylum_brightwellii.AAC.1